MSVTCSNGREARLSAGDWVGLAAAPSFATLAFLSGLSGGEGCGAQLVDGMTAMYGLMAAFHLPPWLKLIR
jgi:hypothetical protein